MAKVADRAAVKAARGTKRLCKGCGAKFYDLNQEDISCPACGAVFEIEAPAPVVAAIVKPKAAPKADAEAKPEAAADETEKAKDADEPEFVSLEEADGDAADVDVEDDVVVLDDDDDADDDAIPDGENDDSFLETEDEGDSNVSDIIGTPIKSEDEG